MFNFFYKNLPLKRCLVTTLIITISFVSGGYVLLLPKKAQAVIPTTDYGHIIMQVNKFVWEKIQWVWEKAKMAATFVAENTVAVLAMEEKARTWADLAMQIVIETALRTLMTMITNDIIAWVQSGYQGKPAFLSGNFGDYLGEAIDNAGGDFVTQFLGAGWLCEEFDIAIKIPLLQEHTFDQKARCTLSDMGRNLQNFADNFSNGGWKEWIALTQPQNNFYGAYLMAQTEKEKVEDEAEKEAENDALMGGGFLSINKCTWYDASGEIVQEEDGVRGKLPLPENCQPEKAEAAGFTRPCNQVCQTQTPASVVSNITNKSLTAGMERVNQTLAALAAKGGNFFKPYIMAIGEAVVNKLITDGLAKLKGDGPSTYGDDAEPNKLLPPGETLPTPSELPADTNKEMIPVLTLKQNLEITNRALQQLRLSQFKIIQLVDKLRVVNNETANNLYTFIKNHNINYTPNPYAPVEIFYIFNYFQPFFTSEISWYDMCSPCRQSAAKWCRRFEKYRDEHIAYLTTPFTTDSGVTRSRIEFERYDDYTESISDSTESTKDDLGNVIKTVRTIIQEKTNTYSFSIMDIINEGLLSSELNTVSEEIKELMVVSETPKVTKWIEYSRNKISPGDRIYSWFEWYIKIANPNTNEELDLYSESTSQEAINHINSIFTYFIEQFQNSPGQTADLISKTEEAINYLNDTYIPAADLYLATYEDNLENPEAQAVLDAEQDMLIKKVVAIEKVKAIDPTILISNTFEDLTTEVTNFAEQKVEEDGELSQIIGEKDYPSNKDLYGLIKAVDDIYPHLVWLYSMCLTGRYD